MNFILVHIFWDSFDCSSMLSFFLTRGYIHSLFFGCIVLPHLSIFSPFRSQLKCQLTGSYHPIWNSPLISTTLYMSLCLCHSKYLFHSMIIFSLFRCLFVIMQTLKYKLSECRGLSILVPMVSPLPGTAPHAKSIKKQVHLLKYCESNPNKLQHYGQ